MARQTLRASRTRSNSLMALSAASTLAAAAIGLAQSAQVIRMEDDGTGAVPQIIHFSMPDFAELRQPEYTPRDLPTFTDKLVLSEAQSKVVENLINEYIEAFKGLAVAHLPQTGGPMRVRLGPDGAGGEGVEGDGEGEGEAVFMALGDALPPLDELMAEDPELDEDMEGQMPRKMAVGVEVRMGDEAGAEGGDGGGGAAVAQQSGDASVSFSFQGADGEEIPEEVRKKLEEAAQKMAEKLKAQMEEQAAAGGDPHAAMPMMGGAMSVEQMQQRQEEMAAKVEEFRKEREELGRTFVTHVQSNLIPDQIDRWPALERTLLRQKSLPKGRLPGERIDLIKIVGAMELTEADRTKVASNLEAYEVSMDGALKRRDEFIATANSDVDKAMQANDPDKALAVIDRATDLRMAVRAVNQQFAQALAGMLPSEAAAALNARVLKASYP